MATLIQTPDNLSLLRNLKHFIIESASEITFRLDKGATVVLSETYYPDANDRIDIDVADVISQYLSSSLPTSNAFAQASAVATFTAYVGNTTAGTFTVVNGGVRKLSGTASSFLAGNWLTWQPQTKQVTWNSPEYLSYYFNGTGKVKAKFYKKNGTTKNVNIWSYGGTPCLMTFNMEFSYLFSLSGEETADLYGIVDVWVEASSGGTVLSYVQRYICAPTMGDEHYYLSVNSLGGIDTFTFHGACTLAPEIEYESAMKDRVKIDITSDAERKWQQNTGYAGLQVTQWWFELIAAAKQWAVMDGNAEPIVIDTSSLEMSDRDNVHACTFAFTLSEEGRLLNVSRTEGELPVIQVPSPAGELFFLRLRLADYPDAELEDTILFLVQSPYTEQWSKTSLGALKDWIVNVITNGIGIYAHSHSNKAVLDKFTESDGKPAYDGQTLQRESDAAVKFLRKDTNDRSAGKISTDVGFEAGTFNEGLTGTGAFIGADGAAEMRSLVLREFLEVPELRYNRVSIEIGNKWNAPGGGIIEDVSVDLNELGLPASTGIITLHLEEGEIGTVEVDDICQGIFHDGLTLDNNALVNWDDGKGNFQFAGFVTSYFRVTEILDGQHKRFRYALRAADSGWTNQYHPVPAMHFVGYGNFTDTTRQVSRYSTRTYERFLKGVNTWEFSSSNIAAQFGDLSNLSVLGISGMSGYSAYLNNIYMSGTIEQIEDMDLRLEIDTNGDNFIAPGETLQVTCRVWRGGYFEEVTEDITAWTITRDSGDAVEDAAWNLSSKAQNFDGSVGLVLADLGTNPNTVSTLFLITAALGSGDSAQAEIII